MTGLTNAYQCDEQGVLVGETIVQEDPLKPGTFLLPPGCVLIPPPSFDAETQQAIFRDGAWAVHDRPVPENEPLPQEIALEVSAELAIVPTLENQPKTGEHEIAMIVDGQWTVLADWRGTQYWLADGTVHRIIDIGETPPASARLFPSSQPPNPPTPPQTLADAKAAQVSALRSAYRSVVQQPVSFTTAASHDGLFACDADSIANVHTVLAACAPTQIFVPDLWLDAGGVPVMPFTYADLQGLAQAIASRAMPDYQTLLTKIGQVMSATSVEAVFAEAQAVVW